jgi:hypothetical protein
VRGNYCTFNPLFKLGGTAALTWASNGNLQAKSDSSQSMIVFGTMGLSPSTKFYNEFTMTNVVENDDHVGIVTDIQAAADTGTCVAYKANGDKIVNGVASAYGASYTDNDVISIAVNLVDNEVTFYKNGASQGTITGVTSGTYFHRVRFNNAAGQQAEAIGNWGQRPFAYTAPSGFKALVTTNLPEPTVVQGDDYFNTVLYDGTGSSQSITTVGFVPDFTWIKEKNAAADHALYDAVRGVTKQLESNTATEETTEATGLTAFVTGGFTVGALAQVNTSGDNYVAWNWKAGVSNVTNEEGTITSTVRANTTSGFSIVTYTGTSTGNGDNKTVGHGLGVAPQVVIVKNRDAVENWPVQVWGQDAGTRVIYLNTTAAQEVDATRFFQLPTDTVIGLGGNSSVSGSGDNYVAYCFAEVEGFSKFSSYTGNGSDDGPFVYTGFRPAWVMVKRSSSAGEGWWIYDNKRNTFNITDNILEANSSNAEISGGTYPIDMVANGFKIRGLNALLNTSGATYIYMAFAENPFKYSLAR